jgi:chromate transport protein ChrA
VALIVAVVFVMKHTQNQLVGIAVLLVGEVFLYKAGIYELWFVIVTGIIGLALVVFERKPAL